MKIIENKVDNSTTAILSQPQAKTNVKIKQEKAVNSTGNILAAGCVDGTIKLWYLEPDMFTSNKTPNPSYIITAHSGHVNSLIFNEETLYSCGTDEQIKMWHTDSAQQLGNLKHRNQINKL